MLTSSTCTASRQLHTQDTLGRGRTDTVIIESLQEPSVSDDAS
jgi:hypothetical protein